jgi:HD-like signal output (HDOD) protein
MSEQQPPARDHELSNEDMEKAFKTIDIPTCPALVTEALTEAQKDTPDLRRLAKTISADVGMSAITIKLANSALFRVGPPVSNVLKGLERLGVRNTVCVVISAALRATMAGVSPAFIEKFWIKTSALALAAGLIARRQYGVSPDAAYTYALFHDAGIPLMMRRFPDYEKVLNECHATGRLIIEAEDSYYPCTHPIIASLLVRNWGLPPLVGLAIRFHHEADVYDLPDKTLPGGALSLIAVTHIAEHLANDIDGEVDLEVGTNLYERALAHFGLDGNEITDLRDALLSARAG